MSKKREDMRQTSNPLMGSEVTAHVQRDNGGSNAGRSAVDIMAKKLAKQNAHVEPQLFDAKAKTIAGVPFTDYSLDVPKDIAETQFHQLADVLFSLDGRLQIYIGDMLNAMDSLPYGDIKELAQEYNREPDTFYRYKSVMKSVTTLMRIKVYAQVPDYKRTLTLSHYALVAPMNEPDQERFLVAALRQGMSVSAFTAYIEKETAPPKLPVVRRTDYEIVTDDIPRLTSRIRKLDTKKEQRDAIRQARKALDELEADL